jgi:hypothetical protein
VSGVLPANRSPAGTSDRRTASMALLEATSPSLAERVRRASVTSPVPARTRGRHPGCRLSPSKGGDMNPVYSAAIVDTRRRELEDAACRYRLAPAGRIGLWIRRPPAGRLTRSGL